MGSASRKFPLEVYNLFNEIEMPAIDDLPACTALVPRPEDDEFARL